MRSLDLSKTPEAVLARAIANLKDEVRTLRAMVVARRAGPRVLWMRDTTNAASGVVPTSDTLVAGMEVALGSVEFDRVAFVSFVCHYDGDHTNRFCIYLDGVKAFPTGGDVGTTANVDGGNSTYTATLADVPIPVPAGAAGDLEVRWNASDTTTEVTFTERSLTVRVYPSAWTSGAGEI